MKKLVAFILTVNDAETVTLPADGMLPDSTGCGALKVEALLSDGDMEKILATVAACQVSTSDKLFATHLIERELALAGPDADNLWQRIVAGVERRLISQVYADCDGVKTRAAARLGIDRNTLHKKLRQYDLISDETEPVES